MTKKIATKLLACPFCGYEAARPSKWKEGKVPAVYMIDCDECCANGPVMGGNAERARVAWNHRGGPPSDFTPENRGTPESVHDPDIPEHEDSKKIEGAEPCPFCAARDAYVEKGEVGKKKSPYFYSFCGNCEACGPAHDTSEGFAILSWNKRFP